jgi:hypothetical protein
VIDDVMTKRRSMFGYSKIRRRLDWKAELETFLNFRHSSIRNEAWLLIVCSLYFVSRMMSLFLYLS